MKVFFAKKMIFFALKGQEKTVETAGNFFVIPRNAEGVTWESPKFLPRRLPRAFSKPSQ